MSRERQFRGGRKNTHSRAPRRLRQHEGRFREIHFQRNRLHLLTAQISSIEHYRQLIARQGTLGKDIDNGNRMGTHNGCLKNSYGLRRQSPTLSRRCASLKGRET